jgi:hypothetical protein
MDKIILAHELKYFARNTPIEFPLDIPFSKFDVEDYYNVLIIHPLLKDIKQPFSFRTWLCMNMEEKKEVLQQRDFILKNFLGKEGWLEWIKNT